MDRAFQYKTISKVAEGLYKDRGSKFIAYLHPVQTIAAVEEALMTIKAQHPKARHVCYAYRLGIEGEPHRINDDGEPSGSAGRPIYNELLSAQVSDVLCAVVRYFGGTKLGVPGLIKAYKSATQESMIQAEIVVVTLTGIVKIYYRMEDLGKLYNVLKQRGYVEITNRYEVEPNLEIAVTLKDLDNIRAAILADFLGYGINDISEDFEYEGLRIEVGE